MTWMKRIATVLLALSLSITLCACGDKSEIRDTIDDFEEACQELDLNDLLECIEPSTAATLRAGAGLLGNLTGQSSAELLDSVVPFLFGENYGDSDFLNSIDIEIEDVAVNEDTATAMGTVSFLFHGKTVVKNADFRLVKQGSEKDTDWYITDIDFN